MLPTSRRAFLSDVGRGMLAAGMGTALPQDLGFSTAFAEEGPETIPLGEYTGLVELMRNTPAEGLQPLLAQKILEGGNQPEESDCGGGISECGHIRWL